jgi:ATP diphosphatase
MKQYNLSDLIYLMERLREPEFGCPWDIKQDFDSIVPHTIEECYEVVDAIETKDWTHLSQELGDLLFQVIFYSQLANEQDLFEMKDVIHGLVEKLVRRHPHVFPNQQLRERMTASLSDEQITASWDDIKAQERKDKKADKPKEQKILDDIPLALPALIRAQKIQKRASSVGFDWQELAPVIEKIEEELQELKEAVISGNMDDVKDEMGDFLFAQVNLARHLGVNAEEALRGTNQKFYRRFGYVEQQVKKQGKNWQQFELDQLDEYWDEAKQKGL